MAYSASPARRPIRRAGQQVKMVQAGLVRMTSPGRPDCAVSHLGGSDDVDAHPVQTQVLINEQLVVDLYSR